MLDILFSPRGVVIVGASRTIHTVGNYAAKGLVQCGYPGAIHFVNRNGGRILDRAAHTSVGEVPDPVDLAMIVVPAVAVPAALEACGERGIKMAIICSAGFREVGPEGAALEGQCLEIAERYGMRVLGPNCVGYLDANLPLDATFLIPPEDIRGDIAAISQSGAVCVVILQWAHLHGFGVSRLISIGNAMDINESDLLAPTVADPHTRVVTMYLEAVTDGGRFIAEASKAARIKPLIGIKAGLTEGGRLAAASHTGALAGRDDAYSAAFRKAGVLRAKHCEEMFDWARTLAWCPLPSGRQVGILSLAGGLGVIAADAVESHGLELAKFSEGTTSQLRKILPPRASLRNPVDMAAAGGPENFLNCLEVLLADEAVDSLMVIMPGAPLSYESTEAMLPLMKQADKPVVVTLMGDERVMPALDLLRKARIPDFSYPERAASALKALANRAEWLAAPEEGAIELGGTDLQAARRTLREGDPGRDGFVSAEVAARVVAAYGVRLAAESFVRTEAQAVAAAEALGFPVAIKVLSPDLPHKSDVGGVVLNAESPDTVADGFRTVVSRPLEAVPDARIEGAVVQPMLERGQQVILGVVRDPQFGPMVMFGSGGVEVEELHDVAFAIAPLWPRDVDHLLEATWAGRRLAGYRNVEPVNRDSVVEALVRLGQLACDLPEIQEVEINPLVVLPGPSEAVAVDVRLRLADPGHG